MYLNRWAIYGTKKWKISKEGPTQINMKSTEDREKHGFKGNFTSEDIWFTSRGKVVYAISLEKPVETIVIKSLNRSIGKIKSAEILGYGMVKFHQNQDALKVEIPNGLAPLNGYVVKVNL
jgi:alpha-L-fucosidase